MKRCLFESKGSDSSLKIFQEGDCRTLQFDESHDQSNINMQEKHELQPLYLKTMSKVMAFSSRAKRVLILGLGGGALVHYFQYYHPKMLLQVIENQTEVIDCAKQFFDVEDKWGTLSIQKGDAFECLKRQEEKYDVIFVDVFALNQLPPYSVEAFYKACYRKLTMNGVLAVNHVLDEPKLVAEALASSHECFKTKTIAFPLKGYLNLVILATRNKQFEKKIEALLQRNECIIESNTKKYGLIARPCF